MTAFRIVQANWADPQKIAGGLGCHVRLRLFLCGWRTLNEMACFGCMYVYSYILQYVCTHAELLCGEDCGRMGICAN